MNIAYRLLHPLRTLHSSVLEAAGLSILTLPPIPASAFLQSEKVTSPCIIQERAQIITQIQVQFSKAVTYAYSLLPHPRVTRKGRGREGLLACHSEAPCKT